MDNSNFSSLGFDPGVILVVLMLLMVFVLLYLVRVSMKLTRFEKRNKIFMRGKNAESLEQAFERKFLDVDKLVEVTKNQQIEINHLKEKLSKTCNKIGIVKYDAFPDVGGKLSLHQGDRQRRILHSTRTGRKRSFTACRKLFFR